MLVQEAKKITGGLSNPSKMPGKAYNLSAFDCKVGSALSKKNGSVCSKCYARKGRYRFKNVKNAMAYRLDSLGNEKWVDAMATLIKKQSPDYFRWHDSGDLQSVEHLTSIIQVCNLTPDTKHWLPTKEYGVVKEYLTFARFPPNLCVRLSAPFIDQKPNLTSIPGVQGSMVHSDPEFDFSNKCPAYSQGGKCGDCRMCWDTSIEVVSYPKH